MEAWKAFVSVCFSLQYKIFQLSINLNCPTSAFSAFLILGSVLLTSQGQISLDAKMKFVKTKWI